jgi:lipopolysaccharide biosynthesis protein
MYQGPVRSTARLARVLTTSFYEWLIFRLGKQDTSDLFEVEQLEGKVEAPTNTTQHRTAVVAHIFYESYLTKLALAIENNPTHTFFVTTSRRELIPELETFALQYENIQYCLVPNRGRNFPSVFVQFSPELLKFDAVIHVHSKKSPHVRGSIGTDWGSSLWDLLLLDKSLGQRISKIVSKNPEIGLVSLDVGTFIGRNNFRWGKSGKNLLLSPWNSLNLKRDDDASNFLFPAGGMFWARTEALRPLLELNLTFQDFPEELGQIDGTAQHFLERAIAPVAERQGFRHLVYTFHNDTFRLAKSYFKEERLR